MNSENNNPNIISKITTDYANARKEIDVPEWGTKVYYYPITLLEADKIKGLYKSDADFNAYLLILKLKDENNQPIFQLGDCLDLQTKAPANVLGRIANRILGKDVSADDLEKN